jgi:hypothetical protein
MGIFYHILIQADIVGHNEMFRYENDNEIMQGCVVQGTDI